MESQETCGNSSPLGTPKALPRLTRETKPHMGCSESGFLQSQRAAFFLNEFQMVPDVVDLDREHLLQSE